MTLKQQSCSKKERAAEEESEAVSSLTQSKSIFDPLYPPCPVQDHTLQHHSLSLDHRGVLGALLKPLRSQC